VKHIFYSCWKIIIGDGKTTRSWEDAWVGDTSFTFVKDVTVAKVLALDFNCIRFRRSLYRESLHM
jgi:hypothetical protein